MVAEKNTIRGNKINLRPLRASDASSINKHIQCPIIERFMYIPFPYALKDAKSFIKLTRVLTKQGSVIRFVIEKPGTGELIGMIGLENISLVHKRAETGYWLSKAYRRQGILFEALNLVSKFAFNKMKLNRVYAHTLEGNHPSSNLLLKCGFKSEGCLRADLKRSNRYRDRYLFGILKSEFKARQKK